MRTPKRYIHQALEIIQELGLVVIAIATCIAIGEEIMVMINNNKVALADLLLLFIYLEVLAMISIYLKSGKLPIRIPLYIAIVALARYLILDMKAMETWRMIGVAGAGLILAITILIIRFGHIRYPYEEESDR